MSDGESASGRLRNYRFSQADGTVIEAGAFDGEERAEDRARELSTSTNAPIVIQRHSAHVDAWEYVTEVDERP